jgi:two-component system NtrC family sensor kinase
VTERTRVFEIGQQRNLGIINPIYNEKSCWQAECHAHAESQTVLGVLDVTISLADVQKELRANQVRLVLFAICAIFSISIIIWLLVQKLIGKPVSQLVEATNKVATGDLKYQIEVSTRDEIGQLRHSFNEMTLKLADAQRQLYQSDKLASLGQLAAGVAHEINNPLTGVLTYSSFLLKRLENNGSEQNGSEMRDDLSVIVRETKRCRDIVRGLLDFARQVPQNKTMICVKDVIEQTLAVLDNQLRLHHVKVHKSFQEDIAPIKADMNQIQQILINLIVNATDAMSDRGGELRINTKEITVAGEKNVCIEVEDNGCGIPKENLQKIFDPFYSTKGQKGTGLGLAVVWGVVEKNDGKIAVESQVNIGTKFTLTFPVNHNSLLQNENE